jgi:hypothetical protein
MVKVSIDRKVMQSFMSGVTDQMKSKFDLNQLKKICKKQYGIATIEAVEHKDAKFVVIENQVACKLDLVVCFPMSILISVKENSNSTLSENSNIPEEYADAPDDLDDIPYDFDEIPKELEIPEEFDDISEELDIAEELDEMMGEDIGDMDRLKEQPLIGKGIKKPK